MWPGALIPFKNKSTLEFLFSESTEQLSSLQPWSSNSAPDCPWLSQGSVHVLKLPFAKACLSFLSEANSLPMLLEWVSRDLEENRGGLFSSLHNVMWLCAWKQFILFEVLWKEFVPFVWLLWTLFSHCRKGITIPVLIISLWPWVWKSSVKT